MGDAGASPGDRSSANEATVSSNPISNYTIGPCIGVGQFGKVYRAVQRDTSQAVAIKLIPLFGRSKEDLINLRAEIKCHRKLRHANIVKCIDCFQSKPPPHPEVAVVTELCPSGDLMSALKLGGRFGEEKVFVVAKGMAMALEYLHCKHKMIHRDLKLQNILLSENGEPKICDFGFCNRMTAEKLMMKSVKGTPIYMAPEIIEEKPYTHKVDLWAFGIILFELFTGEPPFFTTNIFALIEMIVKSPVKFPKDMSRGLRSFIRGLLQKDPEKRSDWPDLAKHPYLMDGPDAHIDDELDAEDAEDRPFTTDSGVDMAEALAKSDSAVRLPRLAEDGKKGTRSRPSTEPRPKGALRSARKETLEGTQLPPLMKEQRTKGDDGLDAAHPSNVLPAELGATNERRKRQSSRQKSVGVETKPVPELSSTETLESGEAPAVREETPKVRKSRRLSASKLQNQKGLVASAEDPRISAGVAMAAEPVQVLDGPKDVVSNLTIETGGYRNYNESQDGQNEIEREEQPVRVSSKKLSSTRNRRRPSAAPSSEGLADRADKGSRDFSKEEPKEDASLSALERNESAEFNVHGSARKIIRRDQSGEGPQIFISEITSTEYSTIDTISPKFESSTPALKVDDKSPALEIGDEIRYETEEDILSRIRRKLMTEVPETSVEWDEPDHQTSKEAHSTRAPSTSDMSAIQIAHDAALKEEDFPVVIEDKAAKPEARIGKDKTQNEKRSSRTQSSKSNQKPASQLASDELPTPEKSAQPTGPRIKSSEALPPPPLDTKKRISTARTRRLRKPSTNDKAVTDPSNTSTLSDLAISHPDPDWLSIVTLCNDPTALLSACRYPDRASNILEQAMSLVPLSSPNSSILDEDSDRVQEVIDVIRHVCMHIGNASLRSGGSEDADTAALKLLRSSVTYIADLLVTRSRRMTPSVSPARGRRRTGGLEPPKEKAAVAATTCLAGFKDVLEACQNLDEVISDGEQTTGLSPNTTALTKVSTPLLTTLSRHVKRARLRSSMTSTDSDQMFMMADYSMDVLTLLFEMASNASAHAKVDFYHNLAESHVLDALVALLESDGASAIQDFPEKHDNRSSDNFEQPHNSSRRLNLQQKAVKALDALICCKEIRKHYSQEPPGASDVLLRDAGVRVMSSFLQAFQANGDAGSSLISDTILSYTGSGDTVSPHALRILIALLSWNADAISDIIRSHWWPSLRFSLRLARYNDVGIETRALAMAFAAYIMPLRDPGPLLNSKGTPSIAKPVEKTLRELFSEFHAFQETFQEEKELTEQVEGRSSWIEAIGFSFQLMVHMPMPMIQKLYSALDMGSVMRAFIPFLLSQPKHHPILQTPFGPWLHSPIDGLVLMLYRMVEISKIPAEDISSLLVEQSSLLAAFIEQRIQGILLPQSTSAGILDLMQVLASIPSFMWKNDESDLIYIATSGFYAFEPEKISQVLVSPWSSGDLRRGQFAQLVEHSFVAATSIFTSIMSSWSPKDAPNDGSSPDWFLTGHKEIDKRLIRSITAASPFLTNSAPFRKAMSILRFYAFRSNFHCRCVVKAITALCGSYASNPSGFWAQAFKGTAKLEIVPLCLEIMQAVLAGNTIQVASACKISFRAFVKRAGQVDTVRDSPQLCDLESKLT
ncbi:Serine/threonine-protein kinase 36 [Phlyctochytrium bullatum]|nr:Serine/threonine-protein kinase 36 [Phlyctochytrium bullatum]